MARIPNEEIERLKRELPLERMAVSFGIELRRHGADLLGRCPFHDDREPSLVISPEKNLWHCMGACNTGGSTMDWVMKTRGVSFRCAVELLKADHSSLAAPSEKIVRKDTTTKLDAAVSVEAGDQEVLNQVADYYHETLKASPEALRYLESRGLTHPEMIDRLRMGFANRTLGSGCRRRMAKRERRCGGVCRRWASCARAGTSTSTEASPFRSSASMEKCAAYTDARSRRVCGKARPGAPSKITPD